MRSLVLALLLLTQSAYADEVVVVCYNYGCYAEQEVIYTDEQLAWAAATLAAADGPESERQLLAPVIGRLYAWAGQQSPIWRDRGGNYADAGVHGSMDCIDHSTTTTRLLWMLERRGALRFHRLIEPARRTRFLLTQHLAAAVEEAAVIEPLQRAGLTAAGLTRRYVVDSWFVDNGQPAIILPLEDWLKGAGPDV